MLDQIAEKKAEVQRLFRKRMDADIAYVTACKELALLEAQLDAPADKIIDEMSHWHPRETASLHWGEDS